MCVSVSRAWNSFEGKGFVPLIVAKHSNHAVYVFETEINLLGNRYQSPADLEDI